MVLEGKHADDDVQCEKPVFSLLFSKSKLTFLLRVFALFGLGMDVSI